MLLCLTGCCPGRKEILPAEAYLIFIVLPQKPVYGDLGAQYGQKECEDAVLQVVAVGAVDDEGARDRQRRDDEEQGDAEDRDAEGPADGAVATGFVSRQVRAAGHGG